MPYQPLTLPALVVAASTMLCGPFAHADGDNNTLIPNNKRLNDGVVANVYTVQHQAGCTNDVRNNKQLQLAAQRHTHDVLTNRNLDADTGSDGSTPQDRANAAGFRGQVAETIAINQSIAISGNDLINRWYYNPAYMAIMSNCANSQMGVWSENSPDRTVVVLDVRDDVLHQRSARSFRKATICCAPSAPSAACTTRPFPRTGCVVMSVSCAFAPSVPSVTLSPRSLDSAKIFSTRRTFEGLSSM